VVEPLRGGGVAAERLGQAGNIVRHEPQVLVAGAFLPPVLELGAPRARKAERVRARPAAVLVARAKEAVAGAPQVAPVAGALRELRQLVGRAEAAQRREHCGVVDRVLERQRGAAATRLVLADPAALHVALDA